MLGTRRIVRMSGVCALAVVTAIGVVVVARASTSGDAVSLSPPETTTNTILPTGETVQTTRIGEQLVISMDDSEVSVSDTSSARVRVRSVGGHDYVIPDSALSTIRDSAALAQFEVSAEASSGAGAGPASASAPAATPAYQMATLTIRGIDATGATAFSRIGCCRQCRRSPTIRQHAIVWGDRGSVVQRSCWALLDCHGNRDGQVGWDHRIAGPDLPTRGGGDRDGGDLGDGRQDRDHPGSRAEDPRKSRPLSRWG